MLNELCDQQKLVVIRELMTFYKIQHTLQIICHMLEHRERFDQALYLTLKEEVKTSIEREATFLSLIQDPTSLQYNEKKKF
jgi:hypothetical protein